MASESKKIPQQKNADDHQKNKVDLSESTSGGHGILCDSTRLLCMEVRRIQV
jgi:hypothetical protein